MKIKAAFFDIDGTLLSFETHAIPSSTIDTIHRLRAMGVKTFLATGRNGDSTQFLMDTGLFDGQILINGQLCELDGECVFENPITPGDIEGAIAGVEAGEYALGFLSGHESFVLKVNDFVVRACAYMGADIPRLAGFDEPFKFPVHQIHCYGAPGVEEKLLQRTTNLTAVRWSPNFADVFSIGGGKDRGIEAICACLGISREETMAFGDGENDISMLEYAGIGVAMGNSSDRVKSCADYVTSTVDEHGVARAIEHFSDYFV